MKIKIDRTANAFYVYTKEDRTGFSHVDQVAGDINIDIDKDGEVMGVEFLPNTKIELEIVD